MIELLKKLKKLLMVNQEEDRIPHNHKLCDACYGTGLEDVFSTCEFCDGDGIVKQTYKEYVDSLPD
ncbi:hypothetical protein ACR0S4_28585 [Priestia megaterium]|uniref:hypothetical protein n=1 Tax=Priestia megaterium TaxID=1404 RepID=UPI003D9972B5